MSDMRRLTITGLDGNLKEHIFEFVVLNDEAVCGDHMENEPTCDYCGKGQCFTPELKWNGETGCHYRCEALNSYLHHDGPARYARHNLAAVIASDAVVYNTHRAAKEWGEAEALVVHPPMPDLPIDPSNSNFGDPYLVTSNLLNKGILLVLELAKLWPHQEFIVIRSPAQATHGFSDFEAVVAEIPNVTVIDRVLPHEMAELYERVRMVLVPSRYETYGMAGLEGLAHGRPCVHVDTPHAREGVGDRFVIAPSLVTVRDRIETIEGDYWNWREASLARAAEVHERQLEELEFFGKWVTTLKPLDQYQKQQRRARIRRKVGVR